MTPPTPDQIKNAQQNFRNIYSLLTDLQLDFATDVMPNLKHLLESDFDDPGESIAKTVFSFFFDAVAVGVAQGLKGAGPLAGILINLFDLAFSNNAQELRKQLDSYQDRMVRNLVDAQNTTATYESNVAAHWNDTFKIPQTSIEHTVSYFGTAGVIPSSTELGAYNDMRTHLRRSVDLASWKHFLTKDYVIADYGGVTYSQYKWPVCDESYSGDATQLTAKFAEYIKQHPSDYLELLGSHSEKCSSGPVYDFYFFALGHLGTFEIFSPASDAIGNYLFIDDGFGNTLNKDGLIERKEVFTNWGLPNHVESMAPKSFQDDCTLVYENERTLAAAEFIKSDDLSGGNLRGFQGQFRSFRKKTLNDVDLRNANLLSARLQDRSMQRANLADSIADFANMENADMSEATLAGTIGQDVHANGARLTGASLRESYLPGASLRNADLHNANLSGAYLRGADLRGARLANADLTNSCLRGACFTGANLSGANFEGADTAFAIDLPDGTPSGPNRIRVPTYSLPLAYPASEVFQKASRLAEIADKSLLRETQSIMTMFEAKPNASAYFLVPLQEDGELEMVVRGTGEVFHAEIIKVLATVCASESLSELYSARAKQNVFSGLGIRIQLSDQLIAQPFLAGPMGVSEVAANLSNSQDQELLQTAATTLGLNSVYLWGPSKHGRDDQLREEVCFRPPFPDVTAFSKVAEMCGVPWSDKGLAEQTIRRAKVPILLRVLLAGGKFDPHLNLCVPISRFNRFKFGDFESKSLRNRVNALFALSTECCSAINHLTFARESQGSETIHAYV